MRCRKTPYFFGRGEYMSNILSSYNNAYNTPLNYGFFKCDNFESWINGTHGKNVLEIFNNTYENLFSHKPSQKVESLIAAFKRKRTDQLNVEANLMKTITDGTITTDKYINMTIEEQVTKWTEIFEPHISKDFTSSSSKEQGIDLKDWFKIIFCSAEFAQAMENKYTTSFMFGEYIDIDKRRLKNKDVVEDALEKRIKDDIIDRIIESINNKLSKYSTNAKIERENFKNIKTYEGFKNKIKELTKNELKNLGINSLEVSMREGEIPNFLEMNIKYTLGALGKVNHKKFLYRLSLASKNAINAIFKGEEEVELHIGSGKVKKIKKQAFELRDIFKFLHTYQNDIEKIAIKSYEDSSVRGFLGELSRLLSNKYLIKLTGTEYDYIEENREKKNLGESFSDATVSINGTKMGLNIKHYISKFNEDSIVLYEPKKESGISIYNSFIERYFPTEIIQQLRFIDMNYKLFRENGQNKAYKNRVSILSYEYLDFFVRISSEAKENFINYFFVINNRYIPTSYIYTEIINTLENIEKNGRELFNITGDPQPKRTVNTLPAVEEMSINNIKKSNMLSIQFKGLRITGLKKL